MVPDLLRQQLSALDVLASLELTLAYGPSTTGRFTGTMLPVFGLTLDKVRRVLLQWRVFTAMASFVAMAGVYCNGERLLQWRVFTAMAGVYCNDGCFIAMTGFVALVCWYPPFPLNLVPLVVPNLPIPSFHTLTILQMIVVLRLCRTLVCEASLLLQCYDPARHARVVSLQEELNEARVQARATYIACRNRLHRDMVATTSLEERMGVMNIDDAVRFQSFMWALISAVNQVQVCCNVVLRQCRDKGPLVIPFI